MDARPRRAAARTRRKLRLEEIAGFASAVLVAGLIGYLGWRGVAATDPPAFQVVVERVAERDGRHQVAFRIENSGDAAAAGVVVRGRIGGEAVEATVDFVPPHGARRGVLVFSGNPASGLDLGVHAWVEP